MTPISTQLLHLLSGDHGFLILLLVKATIILLGALCVTLTMQRAAAGARHLVWLVTLGVLLLVPALTVWAPLRLGILPADTIASTQSYNTELPSSAASRTPITASPRAERKSGIGATPTGTNAVSAPRVIDAAATWLHEANAVTILFALWVVIALGIGASLGLAALSLRRVVRSSTPLVGQDWLNLLWDVSDRLGLDAAPRLLRSREIKMPFACGLLHPTIVVPFESEEWSAERRCAVLLHELAHVRRRDLLGHTVGRIACALYWFHPLVWSAAKHLRSESERACDDLALNCGTGAADYAEHLLDIVTSVRGDSTPLVALAMARRKEFEGRMLAILDPQLRRSSPNRIKAATLVCSIAALALALGAAAPVSRASAAVASIRSAHFEKASLPANGVIASRETGGAESRGATENSEHANRQPPEATENRLASPLPPDLTGAMLGGESAGDSPEQTPDERAGVLARILRTDTSASIRKTAAWGLQKYAGSVPEATNALTSALQHDADADVREMSAWSLAEARDGDASVLAALSGALRGDASESVRATSAWAIAHVDNASALNALVAALGDKSANVRALATWAIGTNSPRTAPAALVARLQDADPKVRATAAWALHNISDPASIPALQSALRSEKDSGLQVDYIRALASMGDQSVDALRGLLTSSDPAVKSIAVKALAGGNAAGPWPWPWPMPRPMP